MTSPNVIECAMTIVPPSVGKIVSFTLFTSLERNKKGISLSLKTYLSLVHTSIKVHIQIIVECV